MEDFLVISLTGVFSFVIGILLLIRENRLFENPECTTAKVVEYYAYKDVSGANDRLHRTMYTMAVEYRLRDGTIIHASEQKGSSRKKYPVGTEIEILCSTEKPDMFIVKGDHSRKIALVGMIIAGVFLMVLSIYVGFYR